MKIIFRYILNNVRERKLRTAVMLLSIVLSCVLLFVSLCIGDSYEAAQRKMARGMAGSAAVAVSANPDQDGGAVSIALSAVPELPEIGCAVGILEAKGLYNEEGYYENFDLLAADPEKLSVINEPRLVSGETLRPLGKNGIVLPEKFTSKYGIRAGDTFSLEIGGEKRAFEVAAVAAYDTVFLRNTRGFNALVSEESLRNLSGAAAGYSRILVSPAEGVSADQLSLALSAALSDTPYKVEKTYNEAQVQADARQKSMPFFLISFFSLVMSVFIIFSSYQVITLERLPVIGTFRSIGATRRAVTGILLMESLVYGVVSVILAIPAGVAVLGLLLRGLGDSLSQGIAIPMLVSPVNILLSWAVAVLVSLLSAYIPVRRASGLPVKEVVLGRVEQKRVSTRTRMASGAAVLLASAAAPRLLPVSDNGLLLVGGFSLLGILVGAILMIPSVADGSAWIMERLYSRFFGNEGMLAARNLRKNHNVHQNITLLFISLSAVIAISVVGSFVNQYISDVFRGAALDGFADARMTPEFVQQVRELDGVRQVMPLYVMNGAVEGGGILFDRVEAVADLEQYNVMMAVQYSDEADEKAALSAFGQGRSVLLNVDAMKQRGLSVGDTIELSMDGRAFHYRVIGSIQSRADDAQAVIPASCAISDFGQSQYGFLAYTADDPDAAMIRIRDLFGEKENWSRTVEEFNQDAAGVVGAFLSPMHKLTYFILFLAAVGIVNNLLINYLQRRRTSAMYKSVGMSNGQNIKMTLLEGFSSGLTGAVIGVLVSWLLIQTIFLAAGPQIAMTPTLDIWIFLAAGGAGIFINLAGAVVPVIKGSKMKLVEEIKCE
ncbi:FtsX-like permease family protein [Eubacterium sp. 1001713B170207_170306_E7]|uniref:ABC transporter permease n=1 Tax=Eubacterium sp. 1001713B170207_170306_E7 TaxID=2787097 RepID=UPI001898746C|nr:FtsX-like permease family protein [Eubacterium sp. 1001713B170207_170306_E7]